MDRNVKILYLCNATIDVALVDNLIKDAGFSSEIQCAGTEVAFINALTTYSPQAIIYSHPASAISLNRALDALYNANLNIPVILIAEPADEDFALGMLKVGVADYVLSDRLLRLPFALTNAFAKAHADTASANMLNTIAYQKQTMQVAGYIAKIGNISIDIETGARDWSCGAEYIFGFEPGTVKPSFARFFELVHPADQERVQQQIEHGLAHLDEFELHFKLVTPAGQLKYIQSRMVVSRDEHQVAQRARCFIQDITERVQTEAKLKSAYKELNLLFNTIEDVCHSRDMVTMKLIQISPACEKLYGYTVEEFMADPDLKERLIHPDFLALRDEFPKRLLNGQTVRDQFQIIHKNGTVKWVENKIVPSFDDNGKLVRIDAVTRDITEQKNTELRLQNNEQYFRSLFENIADVVTVLDAHRNLIYANNNVTGTLGYTQEEYRIARLRDDYVHPGHKQAKKLLFEQVLQNPGKKIPFSFQLKHKNGNWVWVEGTIQNLLHIESVRGVVNTYRDVTERKAVELRLQNSEQRFRSLFENIADVVTVVDAERKFIYANDNLATVLGYTLDEYKLARYQPGFIHPDYEPEEKLLYLNVAKNPGQSFLFDMQFKHKNGNWVWLEGTVKNLLHVDSVQGIVSTYRDVTEQKTAEMLLRQSEQRFRGLVENSIDILTIADINGEIIFSSDNVSKILGYNKEEYVKVHFEKDFIHPKDQLRQQLLFTEVRQNPGKVYPFIWALKHKNGQWVWVEGTVCNLLDAESVKGVVANFRDITARRANELALKNSEANLSAIIENTTDLVYSLDNDLNFITFNQLFKNTIKQVYNFDVLQGGSALSLTESLPPPVAAKWRKHYQQALTGKTLRFINEYPVPDGKVYLSYSINPIRQNERVIGLSVFSRDITKEKLDEIAVQQSEANMRSVFENTDVAINLFDTDLKLISFNSVSDKHAMLFFGRELKIGASGFDYFPKERWSSIYEVIKRVKAGETVVYEIFYPRADGDKEWMEVKWFGVADKRGKITGIILFYRNITEKKNAEIEREKMTADLVRRNKDLEQFTYIVSHNLRAPVANIKGLAGLLEMNPPADTEDRETLHALSSAIGQLDNVIIDLNQMLQVGKQVNDQKEKIQLRSLFEEISLELKGLIQQNKVVIDYDFDEVAEIFTIKGYIYSIFQNLVTNSIKYRQTNVPIIIRISAKKQDDMAVFTFTDNGKGIDLVRYGEQLFGLYKRFDFSVEGKGVGLFMVKMQVQSLGGTISVQSQPGVGTTFTVKLPL